MPFAEMVWVSLTYSSCCLGFKALCLNICTGFGIPASRIMCSEWVSRGPVVFGGNSRLFLKPDRYTGTVVSHGFVILFCLMLSQELGCGLLWSLPPLFVPPIVNGEVGRLREMEGVCTGCRQLRGLVPCGWRIVPVGAMGQGLLLYPAQRPLWRESGQEITWSSGKLNSHIEIFPTGDKLKTRRGWTLSLVWQCPFSSRGLWHSPWWALSHVWNWWITILFTWNWYAAVCSLCWHKNKTKNKDKKRDL